LIFQKIKKIPHKGALYPFRIFFSCRAPSRKAPRLSVPADIVPEVPLFEKVFAAFVTGAVKPVIVQRRDAEVRGSDA
jgi:hypothetical protein